MITDYTFEVRRRDPKSTYTDPKFLFLGKLTQRMQPSISREIGLADTLTFNLPLTDPLFQQFPPNGSLVGLEVWFYGTDGKFKQCFVPQIIEPYRDYGASATGSGSGSLGSGSGDNVLITCDGPECYLNRYYTQNYKVSQRLTYDIINDIIYEPWKDSVVNLLKVDPSLNMLLDIDLSWENVQTAIGNIIAQTGGYMQLQADPDNPAWRTLYLLPILGDLPQPVNTIQGGMGQ